MTRSLRFESLTIHSFKHITTPTPYALDDRVVIRGDNGQGKTTIADALIWTLFGVNRAGSNHVDPWIPAATGTLAVDVTFQGLDGRRHTLQRRKEGSRTTIRLDGRPGSQSAVATAVGPVTEFLAAFDPSWWLDQTEGDLRKFCLSLLPAVDTQTVLLTMGEKGDPLAAWPVAWFHNIPGTLTDLRRDLKATTQDIVRNEGAQAHITATLGPAPTPPDAGVFSRVQAAQAALTTATAEPLDVPGLIDLTPFQEAVARARAARPDRPADWEDPAPFEVRLSQHRLAVPSAPDRAALTEAQRQLADAETALLHHQRKEPAAPSVDVLPASLQSRQQALDRAAVQLTAPAPALAFHPGDPCPVCHTPLAADTVQTLEQEAREASRDSADRQAALTQHRAALDQEIQQWRDAQQAQYRTASQTFRAELQRLTFLRNQAQTQVTTLEHAMAEAEAIYRTTMAAYETTLATLSADLQAVQSRNQARIEALATTDAETIIRDAEHALAQAEAGNREARAVAENLRQARIQTLTHALAEAQAAARQAEAQRQQVATYEATCRQLEDLKGQHATLVAAQDSLEAQIAAGTEYQRMQVELQIAPFTAALTETSIQLFDTVKTTGAIESVFRLSYQDIRLSSASTSERLRAGVELAHAVCAVLETEYPIFLDNAESVAHWSAPQAQQFRAQVVPDAPLTVVSTPAAIAS